MKIWHLAVKLGRALRSKKKKKKKKKDKKAASEKL